MRSVFLLAWLLFCVAFMYYVTYPADLVMILYLVQPVSYATLYNATQYMNVVTYP